MAALALNAAAAEKYVQQDPDTAKEMMIDLRKVIHSTIDEIRTMVHDLRPATLDELGLIGAVHERVNELSKSAQLSSGAGESTCLQFTLQTPDQLPGLPAAVEVAAYRIVTELLVNVVRHSQAAHCVVRLSITASNQLQIEVADDGIGILPRAKTSGTGGIGIVSISERAAELGGLCQFDRLEHGGTRVTATLPL